MTGDATDLAREQGAQKDRDELVLPADLSAMARLSDWVDVLAARYGLPEKTRFAAKLCLEESVSNSIRHGYAEAAAGEVRVRFWREGDGGVAFSVEDDARPFNPLEQPELPPISPDHLDAIGGQGLRLLRAFASSLTYEATATGNRLRIGFAAEGAPAQS